jgi:hypothetical protein
MASAAAGSKSWFFERHEKYVDIATEPYILHLIVTVNRYSN